MVLFKCIGLGNSLMIVSVRGEVDKAVRQPLNLLLFESREGAKLFLWTGHFPFCAFCSHLTDGLNHTLGSWDVSGSAHSAWETWRCFSVEEPRMWTGRSRDDTQGLGTLLPWMEEAGLLQYPRIGDLEAVRGIWKGWGSICTNTWILMGLRRGWCEICIEYRHEFYVQFKQFCFY